LRRREGGREGGRERVEQFGRRKGGRRKGKRGREGGRERVEQFGRRKGGRRKGKRGREGGREGGRGGTYVIDGLDRLAFLVILDLLLVLVLKVEGDIQSLVL